jgi:hypothetical protein
VLPSLDLKKHGELREIPGSIVEAAGFIVIDVAGHYEFELIGAAGGSVRIGDVEVLAAATSLRPGTRQLGGVDLAEGEHPLQVFAVAAGSGLSLAWKSPRMAAFGEVPPEVLMHEKDNIRPTEPGMKKIEVRAVDQEAAPAAVHNTLSDAEKDQGWELLFDGHSMEKWRGYGREDLHDGWKVIDGTIARVGGGGDIITREQFENFDLLIDWRIGPAGNSGIFYHVQETSEGGERYSAVWQTGPEMQILDNQGHADRAQASTSAGANYALHAPIGDATRPIGAFNRARIVVRGDHVQYWLNGVKIVEFDRGSDDFKELVAASKFASMPGFAKYRRGHIALQDHGDPVQFRNIKIRRLE